MHVRVAQDYLAHLAALWVGARLDGDSREAHELSFLVAMRVRTTRV